VPAPKLPKKLPKTLTEDELVKVLKAATRNPRDYAMINLFLDSGIRLSELINLTPDDVQDDRAERHLLNKPRLGSLLEVEVKKFADHVSISRLIEIPRSIEL